MNKQKCKISMKEKGEGFIMKINGYCNPEKPKEKINQEIEFKLPDF